MARTGDHDAASLTTVGNGQRQSNREQRAPESQAAVVLTLKVDSCWRQGPTGWRPSPSPGWRATWTTPIRTDGQAKSTSGP